MIKQEGEATRVAVRNARRTALEYVKKLSSADAKRKEEKEVRSRDGCTFIVLET